MNLSSFYTNLSETSVNFLWENNIIDNLINWIGNSEQLTIFFNFIPIVIWITLWSIILYKLIIEKYIFEKTNYHKDKIFSFLDYLKINIKKIWSAFLISFLLSILIGTNAILEIWLIYVNYIWPENLILWFISSKISFICYILSLIFLYIGLLSLILVYLVFFLGYYNIIEKWKKSTLKTFEIEMVDKYKEKIIN